MSTERINKEFFQWVRPGEALFRHSLLSSLLALNPQQLRPHSSTGGRQQSAEWEQLLSFSLLCSFTVARTLTSGWNISHTADIDTATGTRTITLTHTHTIYRATTNKSFKFTAQAKLQYIFFPYSDISFYSKANLHSCGHTLKTQPCYSKFTVQKTSTQSNAL